MAEQQGRSGGNQGSNSGGGQGGNSGERGFAGMDDDQQREIAREGGDAASRQNDRDDQGQFTRSGSGQGGQGGSGGSSGGSGGSSSGGQGGGSSR